MLNTEDSPTAVSLDALLGLRPEVEEQPAVQEEQVSAPSSVDLLSMLGLAVEDSETRVEATVGEAVAEARAASDDLRALLGLTGPERREEPAAEPARSEVSASAVPSTGSRDAGGSWTRSRFADAPAFRQPEKRAESPAVRFLVGESRPLGLPARAQIKDEPDIRVASAARSSELARPTKAVKPAQPAPKPAAPVKPVQPSPEPAAPAKPKQPAKPTKSVTPSQRSPQPTTRQGLANAASAAKSESAGRAAADSSTAPLPAPKAPAAAEPVSRSAASTNPLRHERTPHAAKKSNGIWYLASACLFVLALACTCYAVYAAAHDEMRVPPASIATSSPNEASEQRYRYSVQGSDGSVRSVTETARFNADGFATESTVSFEAQSESEAVSLLEDAQAQFGDAWVSGSIQDKKAVFTVTHHDKLDREAYGALLQATTTDCELLP